MVSWVSGTIYCIQLQRLTSVLDNSTAILTGGAGGGMNANRMYSINSTPQAGLNNRVISVGIGRVVGGSSAVNGMVVQRGTAEEYDLWGALSGGQPTSWNWKGLLPSFRRVCSFSALHDVS
jgi:choline dehydrogenase